MYDIGVVWGAMNCTINPQIIEGCNIRFHIDIVKTLLCCSAPSIWRVTCWTTMIAIATGVPTTVASCLQHQRYRHTCHQQHWCSFVSRSKFEMF